MAKKTSRILGPDGQPIQYDVLQEEIAAPSMTGIRQIWNTSVASGLTPSRLATILESAAQGDAHDYLTLAEEMEERDMHYASVLGTRKLSLVGLDVRVDAASDDAEDVRRADALRELVAGPEFGEMIAHLVDALGKGYAVSEIVWDRSSKLWIPRFEERDPRFFRFDRDTGRELRLIDEADMANGIALPPYKFVVHTPKIRSGLPIRGGLARLAAPAYMCKAWSWKDWMAFADIYGLPMRVGRYGPNASKDDIRKLMSAVANLGSDAAAVMPESVKIEFEQAANVAGAGAFFETLASWWDKQISKGVLGQTMTTDDGSSRSQAEVHDEVRLDLKTADARALSNTLNRQLVVPFCNLNFAPGRGYPTMVVVVPEPEDTKALVDAIERLAPLGMTVETSIMRDKLGLPDPEPGAELLQQRAPEAAPQIVVDNEPARGQQQDKPALNAEVQRGVLDLILGRELPTMLALNVDGMTFSRSGDAVEIGEAAMSAAVQPLLRAWRDVMFEAIDQAGTAIGFGGDARGAIVATIDEVGAKLDTVLLARQFAQGMAALDLAGRASVADELAAELEDRALNAEQAGAGVLDRGWRFAAEFFMRKLNIPTKRWDDLWQGQHARAFVVAGAMRDDLLADLRAAVDEAVTGGGSYDAFRADFERIVARRGWTGWTGEGSEAGRDWRARVIYQTNLSTSHAAGRYRQMTDPATLEHMPYWQYRHNTVRNPREEHVAWNGLVLRWDDPWWQTHYPPNGWMCRCDVRPISARMLQRMGKQAPDAAPAPGDGDPPPEWAYHVGEAAYGRPAGAGG